jgi:hypothetical protein
VLASALTVHYLMRAFGEPDKLNASTLPQAYGCILAAVITYYVSNALPKPKARDLIDQETGEVVVFKEKEDSLYYIPLRLWALIFFALGLVFGVRDLIL